MTKEAQVLVIFLLLLLYSARRKIQEGSDVCRATGCWIWRGWNDGRYGQVRFMGQRWKAHTLAFLAFRGKVPRRKVLDHEVCDQTRCCNPQHLTATSQSKNMKRCFAVGRGRSPFLKCEVVS